MPKGNHDMSEHASIERACHDAVHEKISKDITELFERADILANILMHLNPTLMEEFIKFQQEKESDS